MNWASILLSHDTLSHMAELTAMMEGRRSAEIDLERAQLDAELNFEDDDHGNIDCQCPRDDGTLS